MVKGIIMVVLFFVVVFTLVFSSFSKTSSLTKGKFTVENIQWKDMNFAPGHDWKQRIAKAVVCIVLIVGVFATMYLIA